MQRPERSATAHSPVRFEETADTGLVDAINAAIDDAIERLPAHETLVRLAAIIEARHPGIRTCLALRTANGWIEAGGAADGDLGDVCGARAADGSPLADAVLTGRPVVIEDLLAHHAVPLPDGAPGTRARHALRTAAAALRACVALPAGPDAGVAIYGRQPSIASDDLASEWRAIAACLSNIARIGATRADQGGFADLASTIPGVVYQRIVTPDGEIRYTFMSEGAKDLFGVDAQTIVSDPEALFQHYGPDYRASFRERLVKASQAMKVWDVEAVIIRPDGQKRYTHAIANPRRLDNGSVLWTGVILDSTRMKLAEFEAAETESRTRETIVESLSQGLLLFDEHDRLIISNSHFFALHPALADIAVPGAAYEDILKAELDPEKVVKLLYADAMSEFAERMMRHGNHAHTVVERQIGADRWILINEHRTPTGGTVVLYTDVSEIKKRERRIEHLAHHDALTGLPNRTLFRAKLEDAIAQAEFRGEQVSVMCLDLDRFKAVNDTLGHGIGDALLKSVSRRLEACLREGDTASRLGGDEFAIILPGLASGEFATSLAWRLIDQLSKPVEIDGHTVVAGTSVGITFLSDTVTNADEMLKSADLALYRAKADGRGTFRFFNPEMDAVAQKRRALELDLRSAIAEDDQLTVSYQPLVDVFTAQIVGVEALVRWTHPTRGNIPPLDFIPLAEETGLISDIGTWVLRRACRDAMTWSRPIRIAVNVSPAQFRSGNFAEEVEAILAETGLKPSRLEIEITESLLLRDTQTNLATLRRIKALGVRVSMDDFGTGYSSLGNLRSFPFDKIKIDRSFIADMKGSADAAAIVRSVVTLGRSLGMSTTAEGVETQDQLSYLRSEGCSEVQGFYYSEAITTEKIVTMLNSSPNGVLEPK